MFKSVPDTIDAAIFEVLAKKFIIVIASVPAVGSLT
jgi:hypothetical protein